ncbi:uncharacterized protein LOC110020557 isoform X1 [Phalaenopsis equestris]|uniref:uncharacterized protein LOC110020557 isoform X1 n=1 Tax=Phalaenopsis equestris TaxID=78828 RepID=UPI0009E64528|nr:uncharacterized protein LOC110020557 isoform X1 [Phalaenopsis equestris]
MLENSSDNLKRFGPPTQRNRSLNRRKSGDRFEKINHSHAIDGDKSQSSNAKIFSSVDYGDTGSSYIQNESTHRGLLALDGCSTSEAAQLLNERWAAAIHSYNDQSIDLSERPIMYSGASGTSWGHLKLPHQMDFAAELRRAINNAQSNVTAISGGHS